MDRAHHAEEAQQRGALFDPGATLIQDYFAVYTEPHRRYATVVSFPRFVIHTATYFDEHVDCSRRFARWLGQLLAGWSRRVPSAPDSAAFRARQSFGVEELDESFFERFSAYNRGDLNEVTFFEALPPLAEGEVRDMSVPQIVLRIEVHATHFSLTLFCPLLPHDARHLAMHNGKAFAPRLDARENYLLHRPYERLEAALAGPELGAASAAIGKLFGALAEWGPATFANFRALILPDTAVDRETRPHFPDVLTQNLQPNDPETRRTTLFLLKHRETLAESVFASRFADVVGCYMLNGHALYLSGVGAQSASAGSGDSRDALRFLLLFRAPEQQDVAQPDYSATDLARLQRWMLSRLVNRMLTIGTNRLLALRDFVLIKQWDLYLRDAETKIINYTKQSQIEDVFNRLQDFASKTKKGARSNLYSRCRQAQAAFQTVTRLVQDLGVRPIPGWQSYDQFFRRRLEDTYNRIASLPELYDKLLALVRVRQEQIETRLSLRLQYAANWLAAIGLISITDEPLTRTILAPWAASLPLVQELAAIEPLQALLRTASDAPVAALGYVLATLAVGAGWIALFQLFNMLRRSAA